MKEKTFQRNEKKMRYLSQLILFEKSYLFNRYSNCNNIICSHRGIVYFWHRNKQIDPTPPPLEKMNRPISFFLASFKIDKLEPARPPPPLCKIS